VPGDDDGGGGGNDVALMNGVGEIDVTG